MHVAPYLQFNGGCEAAFNFYETVLRGKIDTTMRYGDSPMPTTPETAAKIMYTSMTVDGTTLMGSDVPPGKFQPPAGFTVSLMIGDPDEARRVFDALAEGGNITMGLQKTFWAQLFGMLTDRFGTPWLINCA